MTRNQIEYWNTQETKRHNVSTEAETSRHNIVTERETERHNRAGEAVDLGRLQETQRHNRVTESQTDVSLSIEAGKLQESRRHNVATEQLGYGNIGLGYANLNEAIRHNTVTESYTSERYEAQNQLDEAKAYLTTIESNWADLKNQLSSELTASQIDQIDQAIKESSTRIDKLQSDITHNTFSNIESVTRSLKNGADIISGGTKSASSILQILSILGGI